MLQIAENRFADLKLNWILLCTSSLCSSDPEGLLSPIEVVKSEITYFAATQTVDGK